MITKHTKIVGAIAAFLLIGALTVLGTLFYLIATADEDLTAQQRMAAETQVHENEIRSLTRLVERSVEEREQLVSYILEEEDTIEFLGLLETLAREQGVQIEITSLDVAELDDTFEELQVNVAVEGTYDSVARMLTLFETLPYQSYVSVAHISNRTDPLEIWNGEFTIHIVKYKEQGS